jgi:hypothetical protein
VPKLDASIVFTGELNEIALKKYSASTIGYGADDFSERIYKEYIAAGSPKDRKQWIEKRLAGCFLCMAKKPKWKGEPTWPYHQGEPMVFFHQFTIPLTARLSLKGRFPMGETIYVFGSKTPPFPTEDESWKTVYKLVVQDNYNGDFVHVEYA